MLPADKLALLKSLQLHSVLGSFLSSTLGREMDFDTAIVQLLASIGHEICIAYEDAINTTNSVLKQEAWSLLESYLPLIIPFFQVQYSEDEDPLGSNSGELILEIVSFLTEFINLVKREKRANTLSASQQQELKTFFPTLMQAVVHKMKYHPAFVFPSESYEGLGLKRKSVLTTPMSNSQKSLDSINQEGDDDDEELAFQNRRKQMKVIMDLLASFEDSMVADFVYQATTETIQNYKAVSFVDLELALYLVYCFGEAMRSMWGRRKGCSAHSIGTEFVTKDHKELTMLGKMVVLLCRNPGIITSGKIMHDAKKKYPCSRTRWSP